MKRLIKESAERAEAWVDRGVALFKLGRFGEAIASYDHAVQKIIETVRRKLNEHERERN